MIRYVNVKTSKSTEFIDVTHQVQAILNESNVKEGICCLYMPHTTCAVTIIEGPSDSSVGDDTSLILKLLIPKDFPYTHEGQSDAHIKSTLVGASVFVPVQEGQLMLANSQAIFLCEFAGPYERKLAVKLVEG